MIFLCHNTVELASKLKKKIMSHLFLLCRDINSKKTLKKCCNILCCVATFDRLCLQIMLKLYCNRLSVFRDRELKTYRPDGSNCHDI